MNKAKLYKLINSTLSILVAIFAIYYLFYLIQDKEIDFGFLTQSFKSNWGFLLFAFLLMPLNWLLETLKWKSLVDKVHELTFYHAFKSILAGILLSLITPNRIGELGGRLVYIPKEKRSSVLYINTVCSLSQLLVTILIGLLAYVYLQEIFNHWISVRSEIVYIIAMVASILLLATFLYSNTLFRVFNFFSKKESNIGIKLTMEIKLKVLGLSLARYFVFLIQFYFIVQVFGESISFLDSSIAIGLTFFFTAVVPTGWISDLPVRTSIAFFIFSLMNLNGAVGLSASLLLWTVNLLIPAATSLYLLRKVNWLGKLNKRLA